jgi:superfamily II DNA or RNA helicase
MPTYADPLREWLGPLLPGSLLIIDEAHHAAPASGGRYGIETRFTRAVRDLGGRFEHRLFLSATPHNGHSNSFSTLLELLDPYRFTRGVKLRPKALEEIVGAGVTSYTDTGLTASTTYQYRVRAYNVGGDSAYSNTASATTAAAITVPAPLTNLTATAVSSSQINLAGTDNSTNEDGFKIERCQGPGCTTFTQIATVGVGATSYMDTGLTASTAYRYRVRAYNATDDSVYSNTATATTPRR